MYSLSNSLWFYSNCLEKKYMLFSEVAVTCNLKITHGFADFCFFFSDNMKFVRLHVFL